MVLLFDVGNTNIKIGLVKDGNIKKKFCLKTETHKTADEYFLIIQNFIKDEFINHAIISSVVPEVTSILNTMCEDYLHIIPQVFSQGLKTGIMIKADNPKEVGADLIADSVASIAYGERVIIIDLGTATKFIYVENKVFKGCIIAPGIESSLNSLVSQTALLPKIAIKAPKKILGNNTITCMQSGITYTYASMIDGIIEKIKKEEQIEDVTIVATGGLADKIIPLCDHNIIIDNLFTLKGIYQVYLKNIETKN